MWRLKRKKRHLRVQSGRTKDRSVAPPDYPYSERGALLGWIWVMAPVTNLLEFKAMAEVIRVKSELLGIT